MNIKESMRKAGNFLLQAALNNKEAIETINEQNKSIDDMLEIWQLPEEKAINYKSGDRYSNDK